MSNKKIHMKTNLMTNKPNATRNRLNLITNGFKVMT